MPVFFFISSNYNPGFRFVNTIIPDTSYGTVVTKIQWKNTIILKIMWHVS